MCVRYNESTVYALVIEIKLKNVKAIQLMWIFFSIESFVEVFFLRYCKVQQMQIVTKNLTSFKDITGKIII